MVRSQVVGTRIFQLTRLLGWVKLAHMSVKDYLLSEHIKNGAASYFSINQILAHSLIAQTCLAYILHLSTSRDLSTTQYFPLTWYAADHWINHMTSGHDDHDGTTAWHLMMRLFGLNMKFFNWAKKRGICTSALQAAAYDGHSGIVQLLLKMGEDVNAQTGVVGSALQAASLRGHSEIVRLLLNSGADANANGGSWGSALGAASSGGHIEIVRLLLERGVDVNTQGGTAAPFLHHGREIRSMVLGARSRPARMYMENGKIIHGDFAKVVDVDEHGLLYGSALQAASLLGDGDIFRLLLERGADAKAVVGGCFGNALQAASYAGNCEFVRLLLERGADVNAHGGKFGNALMAAASEGHDDVVELLLENGANVNAKGGAFHSSLRAAQNRGYDTTVKLLLDNGAVEEDLVRVAIQGSSV